MLFVFKYEIKKYVVITKNKIATASDIPLAPKNKIIGFNINVTKRSILNKKPALKYLRVLFRYTTVKDINRALVMFPANPKVLSGPINTKGS